MVFNGLSKSDLIVFNALLESDLSQPVSSSDLAKITCYHQETVKRALKRLTEYQVIRRKRARQGQPYHYAVDKDNYALLDT
jgi:predicted transcriptional regulator